MNKQNKSESFFQKKMMIVRRNLGWAMNSAFDMFMKTLYFGGIPLSLAYGKHSLFLFWSLTTN